MMPCDSERRERPWSKGNFSTLCVSARKKDIVEAGKCIYETIFPIPFAPHCDLQGESFLEEIAVERQRLIYMVKLGIFTAA